tara:strand:+ start:279 stop:431 length:153 start_codon:yes stop_codon:yes gene_type:complete
LKAYNLPDSQAGGHLKTNDYEDRKEQNSLCSGACRSIHFPDFLFHYGYGQ